MGPSTIQINIWALPGGLSAGTERTVREVVVTLTASLADDVLLSISRTVSSPNICQIGRTILQEKNR